jgi:oligopeptide/dipeptide ABC transporter ATP-binding protein
VTAEQLLSVRDVTVRYSRGSGRDAAQLTAVRDVSLDIPPAGILALVGESGSGKTSLAHGILQLVPLASGKVLFRGRDTGSMDRSGLRDMRQRIQPVFQDPLAALSPRRSIRQALLEPLEHFRIGDRAKREQMVADMIGSVDLDTELLERYPHELSGGQRQRVALARALVSGPDLVVADEPVSSLDVSMQGRIVELIRQLRDTMGVAFLFVSHDLGVVRRLADSVAVMYAGRLVESGPAERVFAEPAHPYTRALLNALPVADPSRPPPRILEGEPPSPLTPPTGCVFHNRCAEAIADCSEQEPADRVMARTEDEQSEHRVRCHLCKN